MMPRLDRGVTLCYFRPLRYLGLRENAGIPILMYHSISETQERTHPYYQVNTAPKAFSDQMHFLAMHGYRTIKLNELTSKVPDAKSVVITFDDGYSDFYFEAFPRLQEYGFHATVFLVTANVGGETFKGKQCLNWGQIRELHAAGITFGSHTHTHPQLRNLDRPAVKLELRQSKNVIEDRLGSEVAFFSYPYQFPEESKEFQDILGDELTNAGYTHGVTTIIGRYHKGDDVRFLKRLPVNAGDDELLFGAKLDGDYDWLHTPQWIVKYMRSIFKSS
ncbi:polysaccharide deacetylase family protein [Nitrospira sp. BLG_1]|uniref:polysaccharide deacetylase family protein n=1 Tax=Nitrospira sp. BLG_1 TaxID=3395883 RepID=UPI0039BD5917